MKIKCNNSMQTPINRSMPKLNPDWLSSPTANFSSAQNILITDRINSPIKRTLCPKTRDKADRVRRTATKTISKRCDETHRKASSLKRPKRSAKSDADFSQWTTISAIYPSRLRKTPLGNHTNNRFATQFRRTRAERWRFEAHDKSLRVTGRREALTD